MKRIRKALDDMGIKYDIKKKSALVEFWSDTTGQDIDIEFEFDGTPEDFVCQFTDGAENYDVDDEVEFFAGMRGKDGVPETIRELLDGCQEVKDTLLDIARQLKEALDETETAKLRKKIQKVLDKIDAQAETLHENIGEAILDELVIYFSDNHYPVTKKYVTEALIFGYMARMQ